MEKKIKGSMVKQFVKGVKTSKKKDAIYEQLTTKSRELVETRILDSIWYPFEPFKEVVDVMCKIEANNSPKVLNQWGKTFGERTMTTIYKYSLLGGDIKDIVRRYGTFHKIVYSFGTIEAQYPSDNEVIITYKDFEHDWEVFYHISIAWLGRYLELCTNKKVSFMFLKKSWEDVEDTSYKYSW